MLYNNDEKLILFQVRQEPNKRIKREYFKINSIYNKAVNLKTNLISEIVMYSNVMANIKTIDKTPINPVSIALEIVYTKKLEEFLSSQDYQEFEEHVEIAVEFKEEFFACIENDMIFEKMLELEVGEEQTDLLLYLMNKKNVSLTIHSMDTDHVDFLIKTSFYFVIIWYNISKK